ncbi:UDP-N-acetylglucosamine 2-epimerase (non-hydrolyzing) [Natronomonas gomsonensis]|uniref:non-hydrolyzing UDP-N-acetylglucosamine 2-epimerase n=1 Tax=Natronomonas gomsonensis TaxID=1046043 RepID=UPI0020CA4F69|nr:UDP-N-acetylglucosamine 2-epimerase (non-hydrolyzing) [Natronomonas gomsonensis]MCY4732422.1 UDP-N-acetylglucosamine 2-epimerase (non-hydrolyzing) [Natronomonas gomsonensis]
MDPAVSLILGTRPEIIKMAPIVRELDRRGIPFQLIHTGQHYSDTLDTVFFRTLDLPTPDYNLEAGSGTHAEQTAAMLTGVDEILLETQPNVVLVQGDTNSVLAGGLAASKREMELGHVEAGLRSFDREMPEEVNRRLVDHAADYLFPPTTTARDQLLKEDLPEDRVYMTGNTVVDAVEEHGTLAETRSDVLEEYDVAAGKYALLTAHRAENVDDANRFEKILDGIQSFASETGLEIIYPVHPRAEERLNDFGLSRPASIRFVEPLDYLDFLKLEQNAAVVFTDSGGVQEETCILGTPCVTLRDNTERPETLDVDANRLAGTDPDQIRTDGLEMLEGKQTWSNPFGDGTAAEQIVEVIEPR